MVEDNKCVKRAAFSAVCRPRLHLPSAIGSKLLVRFGEGKKKSGISQALMRLLPGAVGNRRVPRRERNKRRGSTAEIK